MAAALHDAAPHRGQHSHSQSRCQGHPGGGGATELDGVALVRRAACDFIFVGEHQGAVGGGVAGGGLTATQHAESHIGERRESCGDTRVIRTDVKKCTRCSESRLNFDCIGREDILLLFKLGFPCDESG